MKKKTAYMPIIIIATLMMVGILFKELVYWYMPIGTIGTVRVNFLGDFMSLAYVKHFTEYIYLSNIGSWSLLIKILFTLVIFGLLIFDIRSKKAGVISMVSSLLILGIIGTLGCPLEDVIISTIAIIFIGSFYCLSKFNNTLNAILVGLAGGGWLGNFLEGNIRGYVIDYAWLLPKVSDQVCNLEDCMIWVGLFGMATLLLIELIQWLYNREVQKAKAK